MGNQKAEPVQGRVFRQDRHVRRSSRRPGGACDLGRGRRAVPQPAVLPAARVRPTRPGRDRSRGSANSSDTFRSNPDDVVCIASGPVVPLDCRKTREPSDGHRGELKGYVNAVRCAKLGILTDSPAFELSSDADHETMRDDDRLVTIDLTEIARTHSRPGPRRDGETQHDPADVGADAKRRISIARYSEVLESNSGEATDAFQGTLADMAGVEGRRTGRPMEEHLPTVQESRQRVLDRESSSVWGSSADKTSCARRLSSLPLRTLRIQRSPRRMRSRYQTTGS